MHLGVGISVRADHNSRALLASINSPVVLLSFDCLSSSHLIPSLLMNFCKEHMDLRLTSQTPSFLVRALGSTEKQQSLICPEKLLSPLVALLVLGLASGNLIHLLLRLISQALSVSY